MWWSCRVAEEDTRLLRRPRGIPRAELLPLNSALCPLPFALCPLPSASPPIGCRAREPPPPPKNPPLNTTLIPQEVSSFRPARPPRDRSTAEHRRLREDADRKVNWKRWGPYLSDRQWGTVREDYSKDGSCWDFFPH